MHTSVPPFQPHASQTSADYTMWDFLLGVLLALTVILGLACLSGIAWACSAASFSLAGFGATYDAATEHEKRSRARKVEERILGTRRRYAYGDF